MNDDAVALIGILERSEDLSARAEGIAELPA
jgi:hypothetical protein